jgi:hypothetical protein
MLSNGAWRRLLHLHVECERGAGWLTSNAAPTPFVVFAAAGRAG